MVTGQTEREVWVETGKYERDMEEIKIGEIQRKREGGWWIFAVIGNGWSRQTSALAMGGGAEQVNC